MWACGDKCVATRGGESESDISWWIFLTVYEIVTNKKRMGRVWIHLKSVMNENIIMKRAIQVVKCNLYNV